jgi:DNA-binding HxlR family transcriptional regulator
LTDDIRDLINVLAPKWTVEVLSILASGPRRYSDLQHQLTLSSHEKVYSTALTSALAHLHDEELTAHDNDERHAYRITSDGLELLHELGKVAGWRRRRQRPRRL